MNPPKARSKLLRTVLDDEVVVYNPDTKRAHSLNRLAAAVWTHSDRHDSLADLSRLVSAEIGSPIDESTIRQALNRLERAGLLAGRLEHFGGKMVGRRELLKKTGQLGAAASIAPVVASILVPTAAAAASAGTQFTTFGAVAFYTNGADDLAPGGFQGCPDTGFLRITNNGPGTFVGTIHFTALGGNGVDYSDTYGPLTLIPGEHHSYNFNCEQSNQGGYGGATGSTQLGALFVMDGVVNLGTSSRPLHFAIYDRDIHSGVPRTNPFGETLDNYILQGGSSVGFDTGDGYETSQAPGSITFSD